MILFWVICGGMLAIALAFLLPTLFDKSVNTKESADLERKEANIAVYRDQLVELKGDLQNGIVSQEQFDQDKEEIERRLLEDVNSKAQSAKGTPVATRNTAYALALLIPLTAVVFYVKVGTPNAINSVATAAPETPPMAGPGGQRTQAQIDANVQKLADKLKANPSDPAGWIMLARSYSSMERFGEATGAYAKATELNPQDPDLWAEYAFATAMAGDRKLAGRPAELIAQALKLDPDNPKALQLAGSAAFEAKDYKKAIEIWQRVLSKVPPGSEVAQAITDRINEAKKLAGGN
jgi:cytochrome c-type biogenesis protein CcmH